jgi:enamine deaminase RidA (YjgF/YER057c/UK114 family)
MTSATIGRYTSDDPESLSAEATYFNGMVTATTVPRLPNRDFELGDIERQADLTLANLQVALEKAGSSMAHVLHLTIYLTDMKDWSSFNNSYRRYFPKPYPVRCAVGVKELAIPGMRVEVTAIAAQIPEPAAG